MRQPEHIIKSTLLDDIALSILNERYLGNMALLSLVRKNLLHDGILSALSQSGFLQACVFHGGTALQRFYGNTRLSEDLDFSYNGKQEKNFHNFCRDFEQIVREVLQKTYQIAGEKIAVETSKTRFAEKSGAVQTWKIKIDIGRMQHKELVKIEIDNMHTFTGQPKVLTPVSPRLSIPAVLMDVRTKEEIFTDKVSALACRSRIFARDVFDLDFLSRDTRMDMNMLKEKMLLRGLIDAPQIRGQVRQRSAALSAPDTAMIDTFLHELQRFFHPETMKNLQASGILNNMCTTAANALSSFEQILQATPTQPPDASQTGLHP